jgi:hypothetical protein
MIKIKHSKEVLVADFSGSKVIFNLEDYLLYNLNHTASLIWDFLKVPREVKEIARFLKERYNIDSARAGKDARNLVGELKKRGLVCRAKQK